MKTKLHKTACYRTLDPLIDELRHSLKDFFASGKTVICSLPALRQRLIEPYHQGFLTASSRHNERLCLTGSAGCFAPTITVNDFLADQKLQVVSIVNPPLFGCKGKRDYAISYRRKFNNKCDHSTKAPLLPE